MAEIIAHKWMEAMRDSQREKINTDHRVLIGRYPVFLPVGYSGFEFEMNVEIVFFLCEPHFLLLSFNEILWLAARNKNSMN